ncbi:hypothetical protein [Lentzea kentuckyensis]|uniref:hypothetical protein n=1 Tax=Lentzea kentuckyensis TaxID=360086 RepID=UPI001302D2F9|nr:hypothetical protein [Lentzea kentuckyensis]
MAQFRSRSDACMTTVVFVHGTGVREDRYSRMFEIFQERMCTRVAQLVVMPCGWGEFLGTSLAFGGASIPDYDGKASSAPAGLDFTEDLKTAKWTVLDADPLHDLRFLAAVTTSRQPVAPPLPGVRGFAEVLRDRLAQLPGTGDLAAELAARDLETPFASAVRQICESPVVSQAIRQAVEPAGQEKVRTMLARAIVAATCREVLLREHAVLPLHGDTRKRFVELVQHGLGGGQLGVWDDVADFGARVAKRLGGWAAERWRVPFTDGAQPAMGDIVRYLTRGDDLRAAIAGVVEAADDDVVLVGHSLGGIASLDLMLMDSLPAVRTLVTVGSQGPLLFELDALPGLAVGADLPAGLPPWFNYYDRKDVLSYLAAPIFPGWAVDVEVDNEEGMPTAHSAYFDNKRFYDSLAGVINGGTEP